MVTKRLGNVRQQSLPFSMTQVRPIAAAVPPLLERLGLERRCDLSAGTQTQGVIAMADNLELLQGLRNAERVQFRCVYLDPPYNNQETYNHYSDELCHDVWLDEISKRLIAINDLLSEDGSLWISIDDREMHYLKVAADKIFGRSNFVSTIVWEHRTSRENRRVFSNNHEYLLVYAKNSKRFKERRSLLPPDEELLSRYKNPDNDPRGPWQSITANVQAGHATDSQFYEIIAPNGKEHRPPPGRCWVYNKERMQNEIAENNVWFGSDGCGVPRLKLFLSMKPRGLTPETLWPAASVGTTEEAKRHILSLFPDEPVFDTPKPEALLSRILAIATDAGDLVLDPYLGSGTTTAVAHKMGRRYIGIERGSHAVSLCARRMRAVHDGEQGGISKSVMWFGGGGFDFYGTSR